MTLTLLLALQVEITDEAVVWKDGLRYERTKAVGQSACYFHPFTTPQGFVLTEVAPKDHAHHRGLFLGWVQMNGPKDADFWGWGQHAPTKGRRIINKVAKIHDEKVFLFNEWRADDTLVLTEATHVDLRTVDGVRVLDLSINLTTQDKWTIAQWAFSGFAFRAKKDGIKSVEGPAGAVELKAPSHTKPESNWPDAAWYGFQYAEGGVAVANRPGNPPTTWHVAKSIGLLNPAPQAVAPLVIESKPLKLSYRVLAWDGPTPREALNTLTK